MKNGIIQVLTSPAELLARFRRLTDEGVKQKAQQQQEKREQELIRARAEGSVTNKDNLSLDAGTWEETYINTKPYDSGEW